jgi:hypothetical protein
VQSWVPPPTPWTSSTAIDTAARRATARSGRRQDKLAKTRDNPHSGHQTGRRHGAVPLAPENGAGESAGNHRRDQASPNARLGKQYMQVSPHHIP